MKLHLGCGKRNIPGFVNVDLANFPHIDHRTSVTDLSMFDDGSVELIYASHVFEYFDREQAPTVLSEWHRVLAPGGVLRLAVPDFSALVSVYEETGDVLKITGPLYGRMAVDGDGGSVIYHRTVYDFDSLSTVLETAGFKSVKRYDWRQTVHRNHDDHSQAYFPHMAKDNGILVSLNIEAVKV